MKLLLNIFFVFFCVFVQAQKKHYFLIDTETKVKKKVKDSLSAVKFLDSLAQNNYFFTDLKEVKIKGDSTEIFYDKGKNFNETYVNLSDSIVTRFKLEKEFFTKNLDSVKKNISKKYIDDGFAFSRIKSKFMGQKNGYPVVELDINKNNKRTIDGFVAKGYTRVPKRFIKNLEKEFKGKTYDDKNLIAINKNFQGHPFIMLERQPQTLFTKDSTQIYLFMEKKKTNTFDGVIGFGNDKTDKFTLNGTLNVNFKNMFNGFETVNLYWQRNPDKGQNFDLQTDIPYLLNSNVGLNMKVNIFRQDSTFANVKALPAFYYHLNSRQKIGLRGTFESSTIIDSLYIQGKDYNKKGIGIFFDMTEPTDIDLFLYKSKLNVGYDFLATNYTGENIKANQNQFYFFGEYNYHINGNHFLNIKGEGAMMDSKIDFSANELYRFGGWNSLRGFNENSLAADFYYYAGMEYRYLIGNQAFFDVFGQYGQLNNKSLNVKPKFYSVGLGFNFFIPLGLMSFQLSNGNEFGNPFKFNDIKIHWGILSRF
ncbi:hypothetical protein [Chryseobacterium balustinum]|uniref:Outer membrane protein/protective antigen OMA87 n=1 Tax=Chryseobacterium balustinum TaxID=246 RepID=A0AAX2IFW7_9FLAO|nr:hypothetical protein [Chryseobacterium balustinum]AZB31669.1 hypothetical protein EB354_21765 [Chryseobacterium balustinum]SKB84876.1 hypothetical protein SAMN05421800_110128 [Chryseobacterium balustinum]SQA86971.1 Outer membrane protein/protective antigen OMA87 [Chryseobacterium balustinum]